MESDIPETDKFQQTELLRQTIKLWTLLIHQDTNPLRQDVNLASDDPTERLISELSRRFPENNHDGSFIDEHEPLPKDTAVEKEDDPKTVCWMKNRVALQDEFVRFAIWKSNFSARDIALLVSDASPLFRSIVETVLSIAETLLELLEPNHLSDSTLEEVRRDLCHMVAESHRLDWQEIGIAAGPVPDGIITEFLRDGSGRDSPKAVDDSWIDGDGDSVMTDFSQSTIAGTDYRLFSEIEKLRHDITSLCDLEITMRKVLPYLRGYDSIGAKPEQESPNAERYGSGVPKSDDESKRPRRSMRLAK